MRGSRAIPRRRPRAVALAVVMIVGGVGGLFLASGPASADVDSVEGTGYAVLADSALGTIVEATPNPTVNPPRLVANEASSDFGPHQASTLALAIPPLAPIVAVGVGNVATQAGNIVGENHNGFVTTETTVAGLNLLNGALTTGIIRSTCTASGDGTTGTVEIIDAFLGGTPLANGPVAANTVVDVLGLARVTLNRQTVVNTPPSGGNPGFTSISVDAVVIDVPADGSVLHVVLANAFCSATGPDVLLPPTTAATSTTTSTTVASTTSSTSTTSTTQAPGTTTTTQATTTTTVASTTTTTQPTATTVTLPPAGTLPTTTTQVTTATTQPSVLVRTGSTLQPLVVMSVVSIALGILLLIGSGRPLTANAAGGAGFAYDAGDGTPERWGPVEIARTIWAGVGALIWGIVSVIVGIQRRSRRGGGGSG